jgi:4-amino-4-deoxy-L-arabinose transferase-like glycosyltransferase
MTGRKSALVRLLAPALLLVLCAFLLLFHLSLGSLVNSDDALYAVMAREAQASGQWLEFTWQDRLVFEKPPMLFWMIGASARVFGMTDLAVRLPGAICSLALLVLVFLAARSGRRGTDLAALLGSAAAVLLLLGSFLFYFNARRVMTDIPFLLFTLAAFLLLAGDGGRGRKAAAGALAGLAILTKGVAFAVPFLAALAWIFITGRFRRWKLSDWLAWLVPMALVAGWWFTYELARHGMDFAEATLGFHAAQRLTSSLHSTSGPSFYLTRFFDLEGAAYTAFILSGNVLAVVFAIARRDPLDLLLAIFVVIYSALIVLMQTRLEHYSLPVVVVSLLYVGRGVGWAAERLSRPLARLSLSVSVLVLAAAFFLDHNTYNLVSPDYSPDLAVLARQARDRSEPVVSFNEYNPVIAWYAGRNVSTWAVDAKLCERLEGTEMLRRAGHTWCTSDSAEMRKRIRDTLPIIFLDRTDLSRLAALAPAGTYRAASKGSKVVLFPR